MLSNLLHHIERMLHGPVHFWRRRQDCRRKVQEEMLHHARAKAQLHRAFLEHCLHDPASDSTYRPLRPTRAGLLGSPTKADLSDDLSGAALCNVRLNGHDLSRMSAPGADLRGATLCGVWLRGTDLQATQLAGADLTGANLVGADLSGADLTEARLTAADLSGAWLMDADLTGADLTGARFDRAVLLGARVTLEQLLRAGLVADRIDWPLAGPTDDRSRPPWT